MRAFYGIAFNDETKNRISEVQKELIKASDKGKFVLIENFHMTLRFLGEIENKAVKDYGQLLYEVTRDIEKFTLTTQGIGSFSRGKKILPWVGTQENAELIALQKKLQDALFMKFALYPEAFAPHITLGREVEIQSKLNTIQVESFGIIVDKLALFESKNIDGRLQYLERAVVHLF